MSRSVFAPLHLNNNNNHISESSSCCAEASAAAPFLLRHIPPPHFRCPISLELMIDPVILCTGQTYDRSSIQKWIAKGNATCPVTMQHLQDLTLIPNHTLRRIILDWSAAHRHGHRCLPPSSSSSAALDPPDLAKIPSFMAQTLKSSSSAAPDPPDLANIPSLMADSLRRDLASLRILAKDDRRSRSFMLDSGVVSVLTAVVFAGADRPQTPPSMGAGTGADPAVEDALAALALLPFSDADRLRITDPHRLRFLSRLLNDAASAATRANAAAVIAALSDSKELPELRAVLAMVPRLMDGVVAMVKKESKAAMKALFSLCLTREGKEAAIKAGAGEAVAGKLVAEVTAGSAAARRRSWVRDMERAVGTMELLSRSEELAGDICWRSAVPALVRLILTVSDRATECSVGSLLAISASSAEAAAFAIGSGVIKELLLLIQSNCTHRAKSKAMSLLKQLSDRHGAVVPTASSDTVEHRRLCRDGRLALPEHGRTDIVLY